MSLTLYINKSESHCECSFASVSPRARTCPHCGGEWDTVSSDYTHIAKQVVALRPDLEPYFPWEDWWDTEEGQRTLWEFRQELQMDTNQDAA